MDSAHNLRVLLTIFRFHLQFRCGFHDRVTLLYTYVKVCMWKLQPVPDSANLVADSTNFVVDSAKLPVFGTILGIRVI